jgi:hypothetical protein
LANGRPQAIGGFLTIHQQQAGAGVNYLLSCLRARQGGVEGNMDGSQLLDRQVGDDPALAVRAELRHPVAWLHAAGGKSLGRLGNQGPQFVPGVPNERSLADRA